MKTVITFLCAFAIAVSTAVPGLSAQRPETKRRLVYSFSKPGFAEMMVTLIEYPAGPQCVVMGTRMDRTQTKRTVAVSRAQFNKLWAAFQASGADKYALGKTPVGFSGESDYFLIVGNQPYVIPKDKASPQLTSLVTELRGYAR